MSLPQERSTAEQVFYTWVARSRSGSSSFTASALNTLSAAASSSSSFNTNALKQTGRPAEVVEVVYSCTGSIREIETTVFDPASVFLSTH